MKHIEKYYIVKKAFGFGTPIGAMYGLGKAPEGEKGEGLAHGALRGLGVDLGSSLGGIPGMLADEALDGRDKINFQAKTPMGRGLQKGIGPLLIALGVLGGGYGGHQLMDKFMGKSPYEE